MKPRFLRLPPRAGSALAAVLITTGIFAILTSSMLRYTITERRGNERNRLILRAKTMSESIAAYAAEQITTKLYRLRRADSIAFTGGANEIDLPPVSLLQAIDPSYSSGSSMEVLGGLTGSTGLNYVDPTLSQNLTDPNVGLRVNTANVPIIAKATARHPVIGGIPAYTQLNLSLDFIPLFQFAVFYNLDLEMLLWPNQNTLISGPVNCNGELSTRCVTNSTASLQFTDRVSVARGFYADSARAGPWVGNTGIVDNGPGGAGQIWLQHSTNAKVTEIKSSTTGKGQSQSSEVWRDHKWGGNLETTTTANQFKVFATNTYGLNLRTSVHGVTPMVVSGINSYSKSDNTTTLEDERNNGRQLIEPPSESDTASLRETKMSRRAGLYIIVNPDNNVRQGRMPDGKTVPMRARSYRCFLNTVNADLSHTIQEVILPGQPSYGTMNNFENDLPNRYVTNTSIGHNQVLRTIQGGIPDKTGSGHREGTGPTMASFDDAYFFDLRRADNNAGSAAQISTGNFRSVNPYTPRPIVKIDFDLTRFRMMVERTMSGSSTSYVASATSSTIYDPSAPSSANWASSIFNPAAAMASRGLGLNSPAFTTLPTASTKAAADPYRMYFAPANQADSLISTDPGKFAVGATDLAMTGLPKPWFDGVTVYIHSVDAEERADQNHDGIPDRIDSAVRLWNGRGPIASLNAVNFPSTTGFTFVSNDAVYIVGHLNANGSVNTSTADTANPGGFSARFPDTATETLCAVMGDAVTILSAPVFSNSGYVQTSGWSDSLSAHRISADAWNSGWQTMQPSSLNTFDGVATLFSPAAMPNLGNTVAGTGPARDKKFDAAVTEVSASLLAGIVPTNHNPTGLTSGPPSRGANGQSSGGFHNFTRLLEPWPGIGLCIRGSMVAMFESRVAMEPWTLRVYSQPNRYWGLHQSLRSGTYHVPLEPLVILSRRLGFREISPAEYAAAASAIRALPH